MSRARESAVRCSFAEQSRSPGGAPLYSTDNVGEIPRRGTFDTEGSSPRGEGSPTNCTRSVQSRRPLRSPASSPAEHALDKREVAVRFRGRGRRASSSTQNARPITKMLRVRILRGLRSRYTEPAGDGARLWSEFWRVRSSSCTPSSLDEAGSRQLVGRRLLWGHVLLTCHEP